MGDQKYRMLPCSRSVTVRHDGMKASKQWEITELRIQLIFMQKGLVCLQVGSIRIQEKLIYNMIIYDILVTT